MLVVWNYTQGDQVLVVDTTTGDVRPMEPTLRETLNFDINFRKLVELIREYRKVEKSYFKTRNRRVLIQLFVMQKRIDQFLEEYDNNEKI